MSIDAFFTNQPTLSTPRLLLRPFTLEDAEAHYQTFADHETMRYFGDEPHQSVAETQALLQRIEQWHENRQSGSWAITLHGENCAIGSVNIFHFDEGFHRAEIGYILNRAYWRQGLASEAVTAILAYAFCELSINRVEALVDAPNEKSRAFLHKLGFRLEGTFLQRYFWQGEFVDECMFALLKSEWEKQYPHCSLPF
jgi:ribosomal-protein-alanine N-acetyltransferase